MSGVGPDLVPPEPTPSPAPAPIPIPEHGFTRAPLFRWIRAHLALAILRFIRILAQLFPRMKPYQLLKLVGSIDNYGWAPAVRINDERFGRSMTIPVIQRIHVDGTAGTTSPHELAPVATNVFAGFAPFDFNVSFACGNAAGLEKAPYGNPHSAWFNVFLGYYELDVDAALWKRPFGYAPGADGSLEVCVDDLARLVEADWNYFSNYMYGVPLTSITRTRSTPQANEWKVAEQSTIGQRRWDHILIDGAKVCSAYLGPEGPGLDDNNWLLNDIWRASFGEPYQGKTVTEEDPAHSFFDTPMSGELLMCFDHQPATNTYRTFIFGGSVNGWWATMGDPTELRPKRNADFLQLQMATVEQLITKRFTDIGFPIT